MFSIKSASHVPFVYDLKSECASVNFDACTLRNLTSMDAGLLTSKYVSNIISIESKYRGKLTYQKVSINSLRLGGGVRAKGVTNQISVDKQTRNTRIKWKKRNKNLVFRTPVILESTEGERNYDSFRVESSVILNRDATSV